MTAILGKGALLNCRVRGIGNRTVGIILDHDIDDDGDCACDGDDNDDGDDAVSLNDPSLIHIKPKNTITTIPRSLDCIAFPGDEC